MSTPKLQGGGDRAWLVPLKPDGSGLHHDRTPSGAEIIGSHRAFYAGLNVANPEPGYQYEWCSADPRDVFLARQRGWRVVGREEPDSPAYELAYNEDSDSPTPLDTANVFQDVVLIKTPDANYRQLMDQQAAQSRAAMDAATEQFLHGATAEEIATGRTGHGYMPTRVARADHSMTLQEGDVVIDQWNPGRRG